MPSPCTGKNKSVTCLLIDGSRKYVVAISLLILSVGHTRRLCLYRAITSFILDFRVDECRAHCVVQVTEVDGAIQQRRHGNGLSEFSK